jgi:ribosome-interacting GTPase 1
VFLRSKYHKGTEESIKWLEDRIDDARKEIRAVEEKMAQNNCDN